MSRENKLLMARLSRLSQRKAELAAQLAEVSAQEAAIYEELAGGEVDLRTLRKVPAPHEPRLPAFSETDRAAARQALRGNAVRRRLGS